MVKKILYLGVDPAHYSCHGELIHYPVIKIVPRIEHREIQEIFEEIHDFSHIIFTSKNAVSMFFSCMQKSGKTLRNPSILAIGKITALYLTHHGVQPDRIAKEETQEGVVELLQLEDLTRAYVLIPRSAQARLVLTNYLRDQQIRFKTCDLYDTVTQRLEPVPHLALIDEIVFTSPSTVRAFLEIFGRVPPGKKMTAIGPITEKEMAKLF